MTTTRAASANRKADSKSAEAGVFVERLTALVRAGQATEAATLYEKYAIAVLDDLTVSQRLQLDELMTYIDNVTAWQPPLGTPSITVSTQEPEESASR